MMSLEKLFVVRSSPECHNEKFGLYLKARESESYLYTEEEQRLVLDKYIW